MCVLTPCIWGGFFDDLEGSLDLISPYPCAGKAHTVCARYKKHELKNLFIYIWYEA